MIDVPSFIDVLLSCRCKTAMDGFITYEREQVKLRVTNARAAPNTSLTVPGALLDANHIALKYEVPIHYGCELEQLTVLVACC